MLTRTLSCVLVGLLTASTLVAQGPTVEEGRKVQGKVAGFLPRVVPTAEPVDRGAIPESLFKHFDDIEVIRVERKKKDDIGSRSAKAARLLQSTAGSAMRPQHRGYYEVEVEKRLAESKVAVRQDEAGWDSSWLYIGGGTVVLGFGLVWWIRRLL